MYVLREFRSTDLEAVMDIVAATVRESYTPEFFLNTASLWEKGFLVAEAYGTPVGFVMGVCSLEGSARILLLSVLPEHRRRGLGSILLDQFIKNSALRGVRAVTLEVRESNSAALKFYTRFGFQQVSTIKDYYSDGESGRVMWRSL